VRGPTGDLGHLLLRCPAWLVETAIVNDRPVSPESRLRPRSGAELPNAGGP
ncbi:MAG: hypothetical protein QOJ67_1721, partial [Acidimicrobiaceae bacterium]